MFPLHGITLRTYGPGSTEFLQSNHHELIYKNPHGPRISPMIGGINGPPASVLVSVGKKFGNLVDSFNKGREGCPHVLSTKRTVRSRVPRSDNGMGKFEDVSEQAYGLISQSMNQVPNRFSNGRDSQIPSVVRHRMSAVRSKHFPSFLCNFEKIGVETCHPPLARLRLVYHHILGNIP